MERIFDTGYMDDDPVVGAAHPLDASTGHDGTASRGCFREQLVEALALEEQELR